jgi:hypothetical protein
MKNLHKINYGLIFVMLSNDTLKMTRVIQGILPPQYLHNVNLDNYRLPHVPKIITL